MQPAAHQALMNLVGLRNMYLCGVRAHCAPEQPLNSWTVSNMPWQVVGRWADVGAQPPCGARVSPAMPYTTHRVTEGLLRCECDAGLGLVCLEQALLLLLLWPCYTQPVCWCDKQQTLPGSMSCRSRALVDVLMAASRQQPGGCSHSTALSTKTGGPSMLGTRFCPPSCHASGWPCQVARGRCPQQQGSGDHNKGCAWPDGWRRIGCGCVQHEYCAWSWVVHKQAGLVDVRESVGV